MLTQLHADLWVCPVPYTIARFVQIGRQLVAVRLPTGGLWIHSPVPITSELQAALAQLGEVRHVVGPNCYHDECLGRFQQAYPSALFHAAPGLAAAKPRVRFGAELSDTPHPDWSGAIEQHLVRGMPKVNELVFFHPASRSLLLADLAFNLGDDGPWYSNLILRLNGAAGHFGPSRFIRNFITDRAAVRTSLDRILAWDFDRIIVGHGRNIESGGKDALRAAFAFLG
ncbi:MAG: DUF4336 domain-containing protein [Opitutae bacterium]|nr:DUF4336 domain-containing protein [Opitutae bacterium]